jgi:hypothetical protein
VVNEISHGGIYAVREYLLLRNILSQGPEGNIGLLVYGEVISAGSLGRGHVHLGIAAQNIPEFNAQKIFIDPVLGVQPAGAIQQSKEQRSKQENNGAFSDR